MDTEKIELLTRVASLYYLEDATQAEIAAQLGFSRPKVARLLQKARDEGIVEIAIRTHPALNMRLEAALASTFGLSQVVLVADQRNIDQQRALVGRAAADLLARMLHDDAVVAVGMGRNVGAVADQITNPPARSCTFVSAIGGSSQIENGVNSNEICRRLAEAFRGRVMNLYAPPYAESPSIRDSLLRHKDVSETLALARRADFLIVGVGDTRDDSAMVQMGLCTAAEMARLRRAGAVGDLMGYFFDIDGTHITEGGVEGRAVALTASDVRGIHRVVVVASEPDKGAAVVGALRTGVVDVLVTTVRTGEDVLGAAADNDAP